jgi:hypothetical protein
MAAMRPFQRMHGLREHAFEVDWFSCGWFVTATPCGEVQDALDEQMQTVHLVGNRDPVVFDLFGSG